MRTRLLGAGVAVVLAGAFAGCDAYFFIGSDPVWLSQICEDGTTDCFAQTTTTSPGCEGDPTQDASLVSNECGVFVKAGATGGDGTKEQPFGSFVEASKSTASWVFACSGNYAETEGVVFEGDIAVYGGFTGCEAEWTWSPEARAKITGPADAIAVTLGGGTGYVENVDVTAANAVSDGGSSIAVLVKDGAVVEIKNGDLTSGDAKAGVAGESLGDDGALNGETGEAGDGVCASGINNPGPMGKTGACAEGSMSVAGNGGDGGLLQGAMALAATSGTDGTPPDDAFPTFGQGGDGEGQNGSPVCIDGTSGAPGGDGVPALPASGIGDITASGYQGVDGNAGGYGKAGQGGGGGGGAKGALTVNCSGDIKDRVGASGGAGGTGGCGGKGGGGGGAGGASIALVSLNADVTLTDVTLRAGGGGKGGVGGNGQAGGQKGSGGAFGAGSGMANPSCKGGDGGTGGFGGPGGGGTGGPAIGIAYTNTAPKGGTVVMDTAVPGIGGDGGLGNEAAGKGADGLPCKTIDFEKGAGSCE